MKHLKTPSALLLALAVAACGGGGGAGSNAPAGQPLAVTPSLGKVQGAVVQVTDLAGTLIGLGSLGTAGNVDLTLPAGTSGFIVELQGGTGSYYFDEALGSIRPLPAGTSLHAVSTGARSGVTVTALTELVYRRARAIAGSGPLTPAAVAAAEASVRSLFGLAGDDDLLQAPELVDDPLDLPGTDTWAGRQARLLAALAQVALEQRLALQPDCRSNDACAPLLDLVDAMADDLADGNLDGLAGALALGALPYPADGDALRAALAGADTALADRVTAVRAAVPDTDALIGMRLAGNALQVASYPLACHQVSPVPEYATVAMTVTVTRDGSFAVAGPFGTLPLAAGNSVGVITESDAGVTFFRGGIYVPPAMATPLPPAPAADGLSISLDPSPLTLDVQLSQKAGVTLSTAGPNSVVLPDRSWECEGFVPPPQARGITTTLLGLQSRYATWVPDGLYRCELGGDPAQPSYLQASSGVLTGTSGPDTPIAGTQPVDTTGTTSGTTGSLSGTITASMGGTPNGTGNFYVDGTPLIYGTITNTGGSITNSGAGLTSSALPAPLDLPGLPMAWERRDYALAGYGLPAYSHSHSYDDVAAATLGPRARLGLAGPDAGSGAPGLLAVRSLVTGKGYFDLALGSTLLQHCQAYVPPPPPPSGCWGSTMFC